MKNSEKIKDYLDRFDKQISDLVEEMGITRNAYYYQMSKLDEGRKLSEELEEKFKTIMGVDVYKDILKTEPEKINKVSTLATVNKVGEGVPYYDVDFMGGFDLVFENQTVNPSYYIDFQPFNNADYWINVTGKSMGPLIAHGDIVALKRVENWETFLLMNDIYAIITDNNLRTIKILKSSEDKDHYRLVPYNEKYESQDIPKSIITHVFKVIGCIKKFF